MDNEMAAERIRLGVGSACFHGKISAACGGVSEEGCEKNETYFKVSPGLKVGLSLVNLDGCRVHVNFIEEKLVGLLGAAQNVKAQAARLLAAANGICQRYRPFEYSMHLKNW